ncbi:hypothetical protein BGZ81_000417 [Podila clonocystis]|nr:hypothetical protein BGZ81_000417 [Podila clonocystis]
MTRFTSVLIACAVAIVSVSAQGIPTSTCVVNTPQAPKDVLQVGKPYTVTFTGCTGVKSVMLRYGDVKNLKTVKLPACANVNLSTGSCTFTPKKAGKYAFSITQDDNTTSYSAFYNIAPAPVPKVVAAKPTKDTATTPEKGPASDATKGPTPDAAEGPTPDAAEGTAPASPKEPTPIPAGKGPQPMAMKTEAKKAPSASSKAEAVRKANAKRALYDIAAFAL